MTFEYRLTILDGTKQHVDLLTVAVAGETRTQSARAEQHPDALDLRQIERLMLSLQLQYNLLSFHVQVPNLMIL